MTSIIKVDTIQDIDGNNIINENADTITIGASGDTISIPAGATLVNNGTASGFGLTWQAVKTSGFTAVAGEGYFCNTTSSAFTVTLPATPSAGDQVQLVDYAGTFDTNKLIIDGNGEDIEGNANNFQLTGDREGVILTYIDSTQGWIATSGINEGTDALELETYTVDFLVLAGGGGGGGSTNGQQGGGGGAGGYRNSFSTEPSGGGGSSEASLSFIPGEVYTVTIGGGGNGGVVNTVQAISGNNSIISGTGITTITSTGGGGAGSGNDPGTFRNGLSGGSGGGGGATNSPLGIGGSGTANQGFNGGTSVAPGSGRGGSGGGAGAVGVSSPSNAVITAGGVGLASSITGSSVTRGAGGSTLGPNGTTSSNATANTGNGGDGRQNSAPGTDGYNGGSGVVILRMPTASYSGTTTGSPTVTTDGTDTIVVFNSSGSITG
jgi:hypothetical protein